MKTIALHLSIPTLVFAACIQPPVSIGLDEPDAGSMDAVTVDTGPDDVDLTVSTFSQGCPIGRQFDPRTFEIEVGNQGSQVTSTVHVRLVACPGSCSAMPTTLWETTIDRLGPGEERSLAEPMPELPAAPIGAWQIWFVVDPDEQIAELDETNNTSATFALHTGLRLKTMAADFGRVCVGSSSHLGLMVENVSMDPISIEALTVRGNAELAFSAPLPLIVDAGDTASLSGTYSPVDLGFDQGFLMIELSPSDCPLWAPLFGEGLDHPSDCQ